MLERTQILPFLSTFEQDEWEGDCENAGIYFHEQNAYIVNKVMMLRMEVDNPLAAGPVFYNFPTSERSEIIEERYPYTFKKLPQKRKLLFKEKNPTISQLDEILSPPCNLQNINTEWLDELLEITSVVTQKREKKKYNVRFSSNTQGIKVIVKKGTLLKCEKLFKVKSVICNFEVNLWQLEQIVKFLKLTRDIKYVVNDKLCIECKVGRDNHAYDNHVSIRLSLCKKGEK